MIYYNPDTFTPPKVAVLQKVREIQETDPFHKCYIKRALESEQAAIDSNVTGFVHFMKDGKLYEAYSVGSWEYRPLLAEPSFDPGINWSTAYFLTEEKARDWAANHCPGTRPEVSPRNAEGLASVHYHL